MTGSHCIPFGLTALHALATAATLAILTLCASAHAQVVPRALPLEGQLVERLFATADVGAQPAAVADAYWTYLHGYAQLLKREDADMARLHQQARAAPGALLTSRDMARFQEIAERAATEHAALAHAMADALLANVPESAAARAASVRALLELWALQGSMRVSSSSDPLTLADLLFQPQVARAATADKGGPAAVFAVATTNLPARLQALKGLAAACKAARREMAATAEAKGLVGRDLSEIGSSSYGLPLGALQRDEPLPPAWGAVVNAEAQVLEAAEAQLTRRQVDCLSMVPWRQLRALQLLSWEGSPLTVSQFGLSLLRQEGLTAEQRQAVRAAVRAIDQALRQQNRELLKRAAQGAEWPSAAPEDLVQLAQQAARAGGLELKVEPRMHAAWLPTGTMGGSVAAEDAAEFGTPDTAAEQERAAKQALGMGRARTIPVPMTAAEWSALSERLGLPEDMQPVVAAVRADATERWDTQVAPLCVVQDKDMAAMNALAQQDATGQGGAFAAEVARAAAWRTAAFAAAEACDSAVFSALQAALDGHVHPGVISMERAARAFPLGWQLMEALGADQPFNLAAAVLSVAASEPDGHAVLEACVPLQPAFLELARAYRQAQLSHRTCEFAMDRPKRELGWTTTGMDERLEANSARIREAVAAFKACKAALLSAVQQLGGEERVKAWESGLQRFNWPQFYRTPSISRLLALLQRPQEPEAAASAEPLRQHLLAAQRECWALADTMRSIADTLPATPYSNGSTSNAGSREETNQRISALMALQSQLDWSAARRAELAMHPSESKP